ncbi:MAG: glycosyltransferase family 4 protein [Stellaceae bacterium]
MNVLVVAARGNPEAGGGFTFVEAIVTAVTAYEESHPGHHFLFYPPRAEEAPPRRGLFRRKKTDLETVIARDAIDLVWFVNPTSIPVSAPYIATVWDLAHRTHPLFPEVSTAGWKWEEREAAARATLPRATRIVTGTEEGRNEIVTCYGVYQGNVRVVPMPIDLGDTGSLETIDVRGKYALTRPYLFYPAQFWPHKNHVNLILALDLLVRQHGLDLDLVLTGSDKGNGDHVMATVKGLALDNRVRHLGFVPKADLYGLYREAFCLAFASFFGPDNIPPLEAFALSCPVVAARAPGTAEQLGDAAQLFDPADPSDIARQVLAVWSDPSLRTELIARGAKVVADRGVNRYIAQIGRIIDELAALRRNWGRIYVDQTKRR